MIMNFNNLSAEGYTTFVLAIIFSIMTIASVIYFARHKDVNVVIAVLTSMVFPTITIFCWVYLIMNVYSYAVDTSLYVSFGASIGYLLLSVGIAFAITAIINANKKEETPVVEPVKTEETTVEPVLQENNEVVEETVEVEEVEEQPVEPETIAEPVEEIVEEAVEVEETIPETTVVNDEDFVEIKNEESEENK